MLRKNELFTGNFHINDNTQMINNGFNNHKTITDLKELIKVVEWFRMVI
jgi:hypothetical protein